jgi:hypothetical protein
MNGLADGDKRGGEIPGFLTCEENARVALYRVAIYRGITVESLEIFSRTTGPEKQNLK